jgi:phosphoribosyl-dephospho-CoA transferase
MSQVKSKEKWVDRVFREACERVTTAARKNGWHSVLEKVHHDYNGHQAWTLWIHLPSGTMYMSLISKNGSTSFYKLMEMIDP